MPSSLSKKKLRNHRKTIRRSRGSGKYTHKRKREWKREWKKGEEKVFVESFSNGLTLIYEPSINPILGLTCICLFVNLGSAQEPEDLRGVSHLIEHMMFKATKTRSEDSLLKIFDSTGAKFNAYTNKRLTCFYIICETEHMKTCLDALSEMVSHAIFDKKELEKEQKIVHEENVQDEDDPNSLLQDGIDMAIFDGSQYATPIDYIHSPLDRKKVVEYYHRHYVPGNMALSIVSSASYGAVKKILSSNLFSRFHSLTNTNANTTTTVEKGCSVMKERDTQVLDINHVKYHPYVKYERYKSNRGMEIVYGRLKGFNTVQIAIGFRTCAWNEVRDRETLKLIKYVFSRGLNGRLYNELREKHGLAYSPSAGTEYYDKGGKLTLYTEIESGKLLWFREKGKKKKGVLPILFAIIRDFIESGPTAKEWEDVKGYFHGERLIAMEKINHFAEYNGKNYWLSLDGMTGCQKGEMEWVSYRSHWEKYIQPITLEECRSCIAKYFKPSGMCIALIGNPLPSIPSLEKCVDTYFT